MAEYDGTIRIGVKMDGSGIDKDAESLRKKLSAQLKDIERQGKAVERLQKAYDKLANAGAPKGVKTLEADLKRAQAEAAGLDAEFQRLRQMSELDTAAYGKVSPETEEAIDLIIPKYITSLIYGAMIEAVASENGARMQAMDNATSNAEEMISSLSLLYNRARQSAITQELTEIIAGAQAIS